MGRMTDPDWEENQREKLRRAKDALERDIEFWRIVDGPDPVESLVEFRDRLDDSEAKARAEIEVEYDRMLLRIADHLNISPHELADDRFPEDRRWRWKRRWRKLAESFTEAIGMIDPEPPFTSDGTGL